MKKGSLDRRRWRLTRRVLPALLSLAAWLAVPLPVAQAAPTGGFAVFAECPTHASNVNGCVYAPTESGEITLGKESVPIVKTQVLQGGLVTEEEPFVKYLSAAVNGETLVKTPEPVPGGLLGLKCNNDNVILRGLCARFFENRFTSVNSITELAAPAGSVKFNTFAEQTGQGAALTLPVKVRLENPLLGKECYIGSNSNPIELELTTGSTIGGPTGSPGRASTKEEGGILVINGTSLVSNTFSVPGATGCGPFGLLDGVIDSKIGLPSAAGKNTAILNGKVEIANSEIVEEHGG